MNTSFTRLMHPSNVPMHLYYSSAFPSSGTRTIIHLHTMDLCTVSFILRVIKCLVVLYLLLSSSMSMRWNETSIVLILRVHAVGYVCMIWIVVIPLDRMERWNDAGCDPIRGHPQGMHTSPTPSDSQTGDAPGPDARHNVYVRCDGESVTNDITVCAGN